MNAHENMPPAHEEIFSPESTSVITENGEKQLLRRHRAIICVIAHYAGIPETQIAVSRTLRQMEAELTNPDDLEQTAPEPVTPDDPEDSKHIILNRRMMGRFQGFLQALGGVEGIEGFTPSEVATRKDKEEALQGLAVMYGALVESNLGLVAHTIKNDFPAGHYGVLTTSDLFQEGVRGLMNAITRFDNHKGYRLSTYARPWIKVAISRGIGNQARLIRLPLYAHNRWEEVDRATSVLRQELNREPAVAEIAQRVKLEPSEVTLLLERAGLNSLSLDGLVAQLDTGGRLPPAVIRDPRSSGSIEEALNRAEKNEELSPLATSPLLKSFMKVSAGLAAEIPPRNMGVKVHLMVGTQLVGYPQLYERYMAMIASETATTNDLLAVAKRIARVLGSDSKQVLHDLQAAGDQLNKSRTTPNSSLFD